MLVNPLTASFSAGEKYRAPGQWNKIEPVAAAKGDSVRFSTAALAKSLGLQGLTPHQIAQRLGLPVSSVISHLGVSFKA
jgi:hypothetical protein